MRSTCLILAIASSLLSCSALAGPGSRDFDYIRMWSELPAGTTGWLLNCPCGDGSRLDQMRSQTGAVVNGVIWVQLIDDFQNPIVGYPAEDMWLEGIGGIFGFVHPGTCADGPSDAEGLVVWREPLAAGGYELVGVIAKVGGIPLNLPPLETVQFVSPDINGDLRIDLADLVSFSSSYMSVYDCWSDFVHDGRIDLADLTEFTTHYGHHCP